MTRALLLSALAMLAVLAGCHDRHVYRRVCVKGLWMTGVDVMPYTHETFQFPEYVCLEYGYERVSSDFNPFDPWYSAAEQ